jgi:1,4-alpha-glucan branching enzyme
MAAANPAADSVRCVFQFAAKDAHEVCLVGSFNFWKVCDAPLRPTRDGKWAITVALPRGRYEYVFVVDGQWVADPAATLRVDDGFGGQKAILLL